MALRSMGCSLIMLILVVLGGVQGGRPRFPEIRDEAGDQSGKGHKADSNSLYAYKSGDHKGDSNSLYTYKSGDHKANSNSLYAYKSGDHKADSNSLYAYKSGDHKVDSNSLYAYKSGDHKADSNSLYAYKVGDEKADSNSLYAYKSGDHKANSNSLYTYKFGDHKADSNSLYAYKSRDRKVDSNSHHHYKSGDQLSKPASNHKADAAVSNQETKLYSLRFGAFLKSDLVEGATFRLAERPSTRNVAFLPKSVADELPPLTVGSFPELQRIFNIQEGSDMYDALETATQVCDQSASLPGAERMCATSFESFLDIVSSLVGLDVNLVKNSARPRMDMGPMKMNNFTQHSVQNGQNVVCHALVFPSLMYGCHVGADTEVVEASLTDAAGLVIRAIGVCHLDTKMWDPEHLFFKILGVKPGTTLCHWLGWDDMVWVSTKMKKSSVLHEVLPHGEHMHIV